MPAATISPEAAAILQRAAAFSAEHDTPVDLVLEWDRERAVDAERKARSLVSLRTTALGKAERRFERACRAAEVHGYGGIDEERAVERAARRVGYAVEKLAAAAHRLADVDLAITSRAD